MNNDVNRFNWNRERQDGLHNRVWEASKDIRVIRPLFKLYGRQGEYATNIIGHRVNSGSALSISINQNLTPVKLSCDFVIHQEQFKDEDIHYTLAVEGAYRVAAAEEAVTLLGKNVGDFLKRLNVNAENLDQQTGLFPEFANLESTPRVDKTTALESIVQGIKEFQANGRFGKYAAIVSLDLYQQAFKPRQNAFDAQIYEIRPLLVEGGFLYSQAAPEKTGVIFSLAGDGVKVAVPVDACVEFLEEKKDVTLRVVEQFRLLVDVPQAVVALHS